MLIEQDKDSPHCYETNRKFIVQKDDIIADVGTAEGIWALNNAEKAGKIYLFESNRAWIKALKNTFKQWKDKIVIVNKYVSNIDDDNNVTLDNFFKGKRIDFIKTYIEGMEIKLLEGGRDVLANNINLRLLLCAYHSKNDAADLKELLQNNDFKAEYSKGYMLFIYDEKLEKPYIRRGLVMGMKSV